MSRPGSEARFYDLDSQLVVEVPKPQKLCPRALIADQGVYTHIGAHRVKLGPKCRVAPDVRSAEGSSSASGSE